MNEQVLIGGHLLLRDFWELWHNIYNKCVYYSDAKGFFF
jgi:hypothetical protein